jgi:hypothetical protein
MNLEHMATVFIDDVERPSCGYCCTNRHRRWSMSSMHDALCRKRLFKFLGWISTILSRLFQLQ